MMKIQSTAGGVRRFEPGRHLDLNPVHFDLLQSGKPFYFGILRDGKSQYCLSKQGKALQALLIYRRHTEAGSGFEAAGKRGDAISEYKKAFFCLVWALRLSGVDEKTHGRLERKFEGLAFKLFNMLMTEARLLEKNAIGMDKPKKLYTLDEAKKACQSALMDVLAAGMTHRNLSEEIKDRLRLKHKKTRVNYYIPLSRKVDQMRADCYG